MATQTIPHRTNTRNTAAQARRDEALRIAREGLAAAQANALPVTEIHYTTNPGPDFMPRPWR